MESYSTIWGRIVLFMFTHVLQVNVFLACTDKTQYYMFIHVLQVNMCFSHVPTRHIQIYTVLHVYTCSTSKHVFLEHTDKTQCLHMFYK